MGGIGEAEEGTQSLLLARWSIDENGPPSACESCKSPVGNLADADIEVAEMGRQEELLDSGGSTSMKYRGAGLMLLAQVFSAMMNISIRMLEKSSSRMQPQQILFFRMSLTTVAITAYLWRLKDPDSILGRKENRWLLVIRSIGGFFGVFGLYYSLIYLDLGEATAITFLTPMLSNFMCSLLLRTPLSRAEVATGVVSFFGVIFLAKPAFLIAKSMVIREDLAGAVDGGQVIAELDNTPSVQRLIAVSVALVGVIGSAAAFTSMRWMAKPQNPLVAVNYFTACCTIMTFASLIMSFLTGSSGFYPPADVTEWALLFISGTCGFFMQVLITLALQQPDSARATNMVYSQIIFALSLDVLFFHVMLDLWSLAGITLIVSCVLYQLFV